MKNLMTLSSPQNPTLAKDKLIQIAREGKTKENKTKASDDFLNLILSQISSKEQKITTAANFIIQDSTLKTPTLKGVEELSLKEATFGQLLQFLEVLNSKSNEPLKFPKLSGKLKEILAKEEIVKEFKEAKTLDQVLKLSKTYDLGLEKLTITKKDVKEFERIFPNLNEKGLFKIKREMLSSQDLLLNKKQDIQVQTQTQKNEALITLKDLLGDLEKEAKNPLHLKQDSKNIVQTKDIKIDPKLLNEKENNLEKKVAKIEVKPEVKIEVKDLKSETKPHINEPSKSDSKLDTKLDVKSVNIQENREILRPQTTNQINESNSKDSTLKNLSQLSQNSESSSNQEGSTDRNDSSLLSKESIKTTQQQLKAPQLRQTFSTFAQDFKEQVESYKPPMMKVQMALNPKNLGEVEVTLINRGSNLHVNFTSSSQTLNLFVQNQAEFKNALVNMGFTNLEMNFSQKENQSQEKQTQQGFQNEMGEEIFDEEEAVLKLVLPNYA